MFEAKVVLHSRSTSGREIATISATYPRFIHGEIMTHRDRARNAASSRAIPWKRKGKNRKRALQVQKNEVIIGEGKFKEISLKETDTYEYFVSNCMYSMIMTDPVVPIFLGAEKPGMQAGEELQGEARKNVLDSIERMRQFCLKEVDYCAEQGLHKSIANRYVEPWMWITTLMTATEWKNFFRLRKHPAAERHFQHIATMIHDALAQSTPQELHPGNWHLPYIQPEDHDNVEFLLRNENWQPSTPDEIEMAKGKMIDVHDLLIRKISTGRCARLSYLTHEGQRNIREDIRLANQLIYPKTANMDDDVIHASPLEHPAMALADANHRSGPYRGFHQFRKDYPNENVEGFHA